MKTLVEICEEVMALDPDRRAVEYEGRWYDWGEIQAVARRVQEALRESGIGRESVSFVPRNRPSALAAFPALLAGGRTVRMIYAFQSPAAQAGAIEQLDSPAVVMAEEDFTPEVTAVLARKRMAGIVLTEMDAVLLPGFERGARRGDLSDSPYVEILTSGTTGPPKQFPISHDIVAQYVMGQGTTQMMDSPDQPPFLMSFPLGNISGLYTVASTFLRGGRVTLLDRFSVKKWHEYVLKYRPAAGGAPPAAVSMILDADIPVEDLSSMKYFSTGAAPLDPSIQRAFEEKYGIPVILSYGATEFGGPVAAMTPALHAEWGDRKFGSVGRAMSGVELRVFDPRTGHVLPPGQEGILEVISPRMGTDWITTSDLVVIDEDGFMFHRGRADGAIMRGGFKILPETVERALLLHPAVSAAGVVGVSDQRLLQVPGAAVQLRPGTDPIGIEELKAHLREHLPATHLPVHWKIVDSLPKTASFKVDRPAVKRLFEEVESG